MKIFIHQEKPVAEKGKRKKERNKLN